MSFGDGNLHVRVEELEAELVNLARDLEDCDKERMVYRHLLLRISDEIATELDNG